MITMGMMAIIDAAENVIQEAIYASNADLGDVETIIKGGASPPRPSTNYPLIIIGAQQEEREHRRAARVDSLPAETGFGERYRWFIVVSHYSGDLTDSYEKACKIWEELKPIVDNNYTWQANVDDTNYDGPIEYGAINPFGIEDNGLTYSILVKLISNIRWGL